MLAPGVAFETIFYAGLDDDGENFLLQMRMTDGSLRALYWPLADLVEGAREIRPPKHAPDGVRVN
jgi:hypothetical protein